MVYLTCLPSSIHSKKKKKKNNWTCFDATRGLICLSVFSLSFSLRCWFFIIHSFQASVNYHRRRKMSWWISFIWMAAGRGLDSIPQPTTPSWRFHKHQTEIWANKYCTISTKCPSLLGLYKTLFNLYKIFIRIRGTYATYPQETINTLHDLNSYNISISWQDFCKITL